VTARRDTKSRRVLYSALERDDDFLTARSIYRKLDRSGESISLATVYRNLAAMVADGVVDVLNQPDGEVLYRRCSEPHHHHLACRNCGKTREIHNQQVEEWLSQEAARYNYTDIDHRVEIFGLCESCQSKQGRQSES
jgi:Fur family ferric uptake transcriptional regulator